jgi:hypothetical protein
MARDTTGQHSRHQLLGQNCQGKPYMAPPGAWRLTFEYDLVLGHALSKSNLNRAAAREVLHT